MAVLTSFCSAGGGSTAGIPSESAREAALPVPEELARIARMALGIADQPGLRLGAGFRDPQGLADHGPESAGVDGLGNEVEGTRLVAHAQRTYNSPLEHLG